jgi:hypothetical protein
MATNELIRTTVFLRRHLLIRRRRRVAQQRVRAWYRHGDGEPRVPNRWIILILASAFAAKGQSLAQFQDAPQSPMLAESDSIQPESSAKELEASAESLLRQPSQSCQVCVTEGVPTISAHIETYYGAKNDIQPGNTPAILWTSQ